MSTSQQSILGPGLALPRVSVPSRQRQVVRRHGRAHAMATSVLVGLCVAAALGLASALVVLPTVAGARTLTVLSGSMAPAIGTGAVVVVTPASIEDVAVGDIVTYAADDPVNGASTLVTHRVVGISDGPDGIMLSTKGDANNVVDANPVSADELRGKVWYQVPWVGNVRDALFTPSGAMYLGAFALLIVGLVLLRGIGRSATVARDGQGRHVW